MTELVSGDGRVLRLPEIDVEIPLAELYTDVDLTAEQDGAPAS